ncbi:MAG: HlyC/CorC family transporter [Firmicutes bacterium]|nr:HlyC/CorC family transporter [Bacillota bacterium]MBQ3611861.1 HlyC/CorC family transporter [Bacillota bacterium]
MNSDIIGDIIVIVILILFSAYFSATETAFTSVNKIRLKNMAGDGDKKAENVLKLSEKYDKLLTTILVGNNIVNITMTSVATVLFIELFGAYGATIATVVITVVVLIFGEITPKNIAKEKPEGFSKFSAPLLKFFMTLLTPINFIFTLWKQFIAKVFKLGDEDAITGDEILTMVEEAEEGGGIEKMHSELIQNAIEFYELTAEDVMTPRPEMEAIETDCPKEELAEIFKSTGYSRLPVYEEDIDKIIGVINQKDFHNHIVGTNKNIVDYVTPVVFVSTVIKISDLLKKMQQVKTHMAIVIDEYGGTEGLVTMEDIIEELVGEIYDEHDAVISKDIMPLQNGSYRVKCSANLAKVLDYFDVEEEYDVVTVNGWVVLELDNLPKKNDKFETEIDGKIFKARVTKADDRKAIEINLTVKDKNEKE